MTHYVRAVLDVARNQHRQRNRLVDPDAARQVHFFFWNPAEHVNQETVRALGLPELKSQFAAQSIDAFPGTSEQYGALIRQDSDKWAKVIRAADVKID